MRARIALAAVAAYVILGAVVFGASQAATSQIRFQRTSSARHVIADHLASRALRGARPPAESIAPLRLVVWLTVRREHPPKPPPPPPPPPPPVVAAVSAPAPVVVSAPSPPPTWYAPSPSDATSTTTRDWQCIRDHESGDNYAENTGNGYSGAYQFAPSTWNEAVSGAGYPQDANGWAYEAPPSVQNAAALWLYNRDGWSPWSTRYVCGL